VLVLQSIAEAQNTPTLNAAADVWTTCLASAQTSRAWAIVGGSAPLVSRAALAEAAFSDCATEEQAVVATVQATPDARARFAKFKAAIKEWLMTRQN
jgi:hypothetical protein